MPIQLQHEDVTLEALRGRRCEEFLAVEDRSEGFLGPLYQIKRVRAAVTHGARLPLLNTIIQVVTIVLALSYAALIVVRMLR